MSTLSADGQKAKMVNLFVRDAVHFFSTDLFGKLLKIPSFKHYARCACPLYQLMKLHSLRNKSIGADDVFEQSCQCTTNKAFEKAWQGTFISTGLTGAHVFTSRIYLGHQCCNVPEMMDLVYPAGWCLYRTSVSKPRAQLRPPRIQRSHRWIGECLDDILIDIGK